MSDDTFGRVIVSRAERLGRTDSAWESGFLNAWLADRDALTDAERSVVLSARANVREREHPDPLIASIRRAEREQYLRDDEGR